MSIRQQAEAELKRVNFGDEDSAVMLKILDLFLDQWDSGGAVSVAQDVLARLISGQPLSALTGADDEWFVHDFPDGVYAQNIRCGTVFKNRDGSTYDVASGYRVPVTFPYDPTTRLVDPPVYSFGPSA